ncbi:hypothetical protein D3C72_1828250 [compost metagenome]
MTILNATSEASSKEPTPAPAIPSTTSSPSCRPKIVALAFFTPYDRPCDIDSTAPEPGETAMMEAAMTKVIQVAKCMRFPKKWWRSTILTRSVRPCRPALR